MTRANLFLISLCGATFIPLIGLPIASFCCGPVSMNSAAWSISIFVAGSGHVAATFFFYYDPEAKDLRNHQRRYFIAIPITIIACTTLLYRYGSPVVQSFIVLSSSAWLFYHYQKQNYGVISFASRGLPEKVAEDTWRVLLLSTIAGFFSFSRLIFNYSAAPFGNPLLELPSAGNTGANDILFTAAVVFYVISGIFFVRLIYQSPELRQNPFALLFSVAGFAFFLPTFLTEAEPFVIFWSFAFAHGLQYIIFVAVTATHRGARESISSLRPIYVPILAFICAVLIGGAIIKFSETYLTGMAIGITMAHFVIDSRIWKLRHRESRTYVLSKFSFLFKPATNPK